MLFQNDISTLESEIAKFEGIISTRRARIEQLSQAETLADSAIQSLRDAVGKVQTLAPDAIAALRTAVLALFGTADSSGNEPELETNPPASEAEGGEATQVTSSDQETVPPGSLIQIENPHTGEKISWVTPPEPSSTEESSDHGMNLLYSKVKQVTEPAVTDESSARPYVQFVTLNETVAFQRRHDGEIICGYLGAATSQLAKRWSEALELWGATTEIRKGKRIEGARWEIKFKNIDISRLNKIAESHPSFSSGVPSPKPESAEFPPDTQSDSSKNSTKCGDTTNPLASELPEFTFTEAPGSCQLTPDFMVYAPDGEYLGKVRESLTLKGWLHKHTDHKKPFSSREEAALDLYRRKKAQQQIHDTANARILAARGF